MIDLTVTNKIIISFSTLFQSVYRRERNRDATSDDEISDDSQATECLSDDKDIGDTTEDDIDYVAEDLRLARKKIKRAAGLYCMGDDGGTGLEELVLPQSGDDLMVGPAMSLRVAAVYEVMCFCLLALLL